LRWALGRLAALGLARAVAVDLTRTDFAIPVVRLLSQVSNGTRTTRITGPVGAPWRSRHHDRDHLRRAVTAARLRPARAVDRVAARRSGR